MDPDTENSEGILFLGLCVCMQKTLAITFELLDLELYFVGRTFLNILKTKSNFTLLLYT